MSKIGHVLVVALLIGAFFAGIPQKAVGPRPPFVVPEVAAHAPDPGDNWKRNFVSDGLTRLVHAPTLVELGDGRIRAFWYAGSREGAADVGIHTAVFNPDTGRWSPSHRIISRMQIARALNRHIRKLGNMVPVRRNGRLELYVVTVSFGGWAGSRLVVLESEDGGQTWEVKKGLVTSPFLNVSTLVKNRAVHYQDGSIGLPVYHEFLGKFGELLRISEDYQILSDDHIGYGRTAIQPMIFVTGPYTARAYLRNASAERPGMLFSSWTYDGGDTWTPLRDSGLPNPGSAASGVSLGPEHWLMALNNNPDERDDLMILETRDAGKHWRVIKVLHDRSRFRHHPIPPARFSRLIRQSLPEHLKGAPPVSEIIARARETKCSKNGCLFQFDYPYMLRASNGDIHVVYTWNKTMIAHAWWDAPDKPQSDSVKKGAL